MHASDLVVAGLVPANDRRHRCGIGPRYRPAKPVNRHSELARQRSDISRGGPQTDEAEWPAGWPLRREISLTLPPLACGSLRNDIQAASRRGSVVTISGSGRPLWWPLIAVDSGKVAFVPLKAILFDLGDVIMREETEEKVDGVTQRADLHPGMADLLRQLHDRQIPLGLVADTRDGTYRNVLGMHGLMAVFDAFAISDHLGMEKPDRRIFEHALRELGIAESDRGEVAMVGNNLARDIRGANALGLIGIWMVWNQRYPCACADDLETPEFQVSTAAGLDALLDALHAGTDTTAYRYPQPFPWG
jgi:putative hydrolase of the HAD superfamily